MGAMADATRTLDAQRRALAYGRRTRRQVAYALIEMASRLLAAAQKVLEEEQ